MHAADCVILLRVRIRLTLAGRKSLARSIHCILTRPTRGRFALISPEGYRELYRTVCIQHLLSFSPHGCLPPSTT